MPVALDLFCCRGGMSVGLNQAGFEVYGIDNVPQPLYPFEFMHTDAIAALEALVDGKRLDFSGTLLGVDDIDFIHASPPCQKWTRGNAGFETDHLDLITPSRHLLNELGIPYTIENVEGAPLLNPVTLCGTMFNMTAIDTDGTLLRLKRHRNFENNWNMIGPEHGPHPRNVQWAGAYGGARRDKDEARHVRKGGYVPADLNVLRELVGTPWMDEYGIFQSVPPAYGEFIGQQFLNHTGA